MFWKIKFSEQTYVIYKIWSVQRLCFDGKKFRFGDQLWQEKEKAASSNIKHVAQLHGWRKLQDKKSRRKWQLNLSGLCFQTYDFLPTRLHFLQDSLLRNFLIGEQLFRNLNFSVVYM